MRGFACHRRYRRRGALLPHLFTLTLRLATSWLAQGKPLSEACLERAAKRRVERRYVFCATFRQVALPGRYPAHCPMEFGLSSRLRAFGASAGDRLANCDLSIIKSQGPNPKTRIPIPKSSG